MVRWVLKKSWPEWTFLHMHVCKYPKLNQRVWRKGEENRKCLKGVSKTTKKLYIDQLLVRGSPSLPSTKSGGNWNFSKSSGEEKEGERGNFWNFYWGENCWKMKLQTENILSQLYIYDKLFKQLFFLWFFQHTLLLSLLYSASIPCANHMGTHL